jgi:urease accessory protein UreF
MGSTLHDSPLKAVNFQSLPSEDAEDVETASYSAESSAAVREKQASRKKIAADLRRLKKEVEELEAWTKKIETNPELKGDTGGLDRFL